MSYLTDRQQIVDIEGISSNRNKIRNIKIGVQQGSFFGHLIILTFRKGPIKNS